LFLSFDDSEKEIKEMNRITKIYNKSEKTDTLIVKFFDKKESPPMGHVKFNDQYFYADYEGGLVKIPKSTFVNEENPIVETFIQGAIVKIELINVTELHSLEINAYHIYGTYHFESNFERVMKYRGTELKSKDFYNTTRKRTVTFVSENDKSSHEKP